MTTSPATPATHRDELRLAESRLQDCLERAAGDSPKTWASHPSGLPGWSRGHVVAHLLGNLDGLLNLVEWAQTGVPTPMYASPEAREAAIQERSGWTLTRLAAAMTTRAEEFARACSALTEPLPSRQLRLGSGAAAQAWELPMLRVREIEIHQVDLADGYVATDWSAAFTVRTLGQVQPAMAGRGGLPVARLRATDTGRVWECAPQGPDLWGREADLLAWLVGRPYVGLSLVAPQLGTPRPGLRVVDPGAAVPPAPRWV